MDPQIFLKNHHRKGKNTMGLIVARQNLQDHIGEMLAPGEWFVVDQSCINQFADVTLDHQFIHVDKEKARNSVFGSTIAHGFLTKCDFSIR